MASLTYTAYLSRNLIKYGGAGIVVFTVLWTISTAAIKAYQAAHPPYIPPTVRYGLLPKMVFPTKQFDKKTFSLELPNDSYPKFKDQAKVYFIPRPTSNFLALEVDRETAKQLGFSSEPTPIRDGVYEFKNDILNQTLTMNVLEGSFHLSYPYQSDQTLLSPSRIPTKEQAIEIARQYLSQAQKYDTDLEQGEKKVTFWQIEYNGLKSVPSQSSANAVRVDFFRQPLEGNFQIIANSPKEAQVSVLESGVETQGRQVIDISYKYAKIDREAYSTYPIKTPEAAFENLKQGSYWPASDTTGNGVTIRNVYLAYFEPVTLTNFLQPIYVFEGDKGFVAYVPAISDKWIKQ